MGLKSLTKKEEKILLKYETDKKSLTEEEKNIRKKIAQREASRKWARKNSKYLSTYRKTYRSKNIDKSWITTPGPEGFYRYGGKELSHIDREERRKKKYDDNLLKLNKLYKEDEEFRKKRLEYDKKYQLDKKLNKK